MSDVISGMSVGPVVPNNPVKLGDPRLNRSREKFELKPSEAGGIFDGFVAVASDRNQIVTSYPVQM